MSTLTGHGIAVQLPRGWDGRIFRRAGTSEPQAAALRAAGAGPVEVVLPVLHAASFPLPLDAGDFGGGAVELMGRDDVFVAMLEYEAASAGTALFAARGLPPALRVRDFDPRALQRTLPGQLGLQRFLSEQGRAFCLYVVLGSLTAASTLVAEVNAVVGSLAITSDPSAGAS